MQLLLTRSQREGGIISKTAIFCLYARVSFTAEESHSIQRYKLRNEVIYNSQAQEQLIDRMDAAHASGSYMKSIGFALMARMKLHITVGSLERGQPIECKSLEEMRAAEDAIMAACHNLKQYLDLAATFDGRQVVYEFASEGPTLIAEATPQPMLIVQPAPQPTSSVAQAAPAPVLTAVEATPEPAPVVHVEIAPEAEPASSTATPTPPPVRQPFFSEGTEGERQKSIMFFVGVAISLAILIAAIL